MIAKYMYKRGKRSDQIRWGWESKLNAEGKVVEAKRIRNDKVKQISAYTYRDGHRISATVTKGDGSLKYKYKYKYNDKGLMTEVLRYDEDDILSGKNIYEYQYY